MAPNNIQFKRVGVWGTEASGKTTYLGSMAWAERENWRFIPDGEEAEAYYDLIVHRMSDGDFPLATDPNDPPRIYDFIFQYDPTGKDRWLFNKTVVTNRVSVLDAPGSFYREKSDLWQVPGFDSVWDYLAQCDGLLCLFDPDDAENQFKPITKMLNNVRRIKQKSRPETEVALVDMPLAFVMTKMDQTKHIAHFNTPYEYAQELLSEVTMKTIRSFCTRDTFEFFAVSAIGMQPDGRTSNADNDTGKILRPRNITPIDAFVPLYWLFTRMV